MKKWFYILISLAFVTFVGFLVFMNFPFVVGDYSLVIIYPQNKYESRTEITDKNEIETIKHSINNSPRRFRGLLRRPLDYDAAFRGYVVFVNENSSKKFHGIIHNGNIVTKYWDVDTDFFGKYRNETEYK